MRTGELKSLMLKRYPANAWTLCWEVSDATGARLSRHADAIAMSLWPSRGTDLHGFELKVSRADWLKELSTPEKAEPVMRYCDYWWLVVSDESIVSLQNGEVPEPWGLLVASGNSLRVEKKAARLAASPISRDFLAALLRAAAKPAAATDADMLSRERQKGRDDAVKSFERVQSELRSELLSTHKRLLELQSKVVAFENSSGVCIRNAQDKIEDIGAAVRRVMRGDEIDLRGMESVRIAAESILSQVNREMSQIRRRIESRAQGATS